MGGGEDSATTSSYSVPPLLLFSLGKEVKKREGGVEGAGGGLLSECLGVPRLALSHGSFNQRHYFTAKTSLAANMTGSV